MAASGTGHAGKLTTHVLDTAGGCPAAGVRVVLYRLGDARRETICEAVTNADGRCDAPLLAGAALRRGRYEISFHVGAYYRSRGLAADDPAFLDEVPVRFGIAAVEEHYHVPLLLSPFGYTTYRGS